MQLRCNASRQSLSTTLIVALNRASCIKSYPINKSVSFLPLQSFLSGSRQINPSAAIMQRQLFCSTTTRAFISSCYGFIPCCLIYYFLVVTSCIVMNCGIFCVVVNNGGFRIVMNGACLNCSRIISTTIARINKRMLCIYVTECIIRWIDESTYITLNHLLIHRLIPCLFCYNGFIPCLFCYNGFIPCSRILYPNILIGCIVVNCSGNCYPVVCMCCGCRCGSLRSLGSGSCFWCLSRCCCCRRTGCWCCRRLCCRLRGRLCIRSFRCLWCLCGTRSCSWLRACSLLSGFLCRACCFCFLTSFGRGRITRAAQVCRPYGVGRRESQSWREAQGPPLRFQFPQRRSEASHKVLLPTFLSRKVGQEK